VEKILIAKYIPEVRERVKEYITGCVTAEKDDPVLFNFLFNSALKGRGMDSGEAIPQMDSAPTTSSSTSRPLYRPIGQTKQYGETGYWNLNLQDQNENLVTPNKFWADYATFVASGKEEAFNSKYFPYARNNVTAVMFALSVLDMPFASVEHTPKFEEGKMKLSARTPVVVFHKEIRETKLGSGQVLVTQNYFDPGEATSTNADGEEVDKYIDEFLQYRPYATQVILTNISQSNQKLEVLLQIPEGAMPLNNGFFTEGKFIELSPSETRTLYYYFYFPKTSTYSHYPVQVAKNEKVICCAEPRQLKVVSKLSVVDTKSWDYISQHASVEELVKFLAENNLHSSKIDLSRIYWRMTDRTTFEQIIRILRSKLIYDNNMWSYCLTHKGPVDIAREFLSHNAVFTQYLKPVFHSSLIDVKAEDHYEYFEYFPIVNERAHSLFDSLADQISNPQFREQYTEFLDYVAYKKTLSVEDKVTATYYLVLQERVEEAQKMFESIEGKPVKSLEIQYDYLAAYLDFFNETPAKAGKIAEKYKEYPVESWRKRFAVITQQLREIAGEKVEGDKNLDRAENLSQLTESEPSFDFSIKDMKVHVHYQNLSKVTVSFFETDIELLFSTSAFSLQQLDQFSYVKPNKSVEVTLKEEIKDAEVEIPKELRNSNMIISVHGHGIIKSLPFYSHSLHVNVFENYGQLKVTEKETSKPLSKVYVKVYSMSHSRVEFYKDGYTDLRGRFDYVTKTGSDLNSLQKFSILILSETHGAVTKEVGVPAM